MSAKAISEFDGKQLLSRALCQLPCASIGRVVRVAIGAERSLDEVFRQAEAENPWVLEASLVAKPDQLIKRRGKSGLIILKVGWAQVKDWIRQTAAQPVNVVGITGTIKNFIVEPFLEHEQSQEYYVCVRSVDEGDEILLAAEGGINVGDVDAKAKKMLIKPLEAMDVESLNKLVAKTFPSVTAGHLENLRAFIGDLYRVFVSHHFTYLEVNPLVQTGDGKIHMLDLAAKLDQTAEFVCSALWGDIPFPTPFGREATPEEEYIAELDAKTGASLKLTVLNKDGRIWTMVAGGGASVAFSDAIASLGYASELANYGEYSGAPSETQTYEYSRTILDLMTRGAPNPQGKILFIGGGIANFTNVASTFKGIIRAIESYHHELIRHGVQIWVRRAGPNYQEGLQMMRELGGRLSLPIHVYGPEMHITGIVPLALKGDDAGVNTSADLYSMGNQSANDLLRCFTPCQPERLSGTASPVKSSAASITKSLDNLSIITDFDGNSTMHRSTRALVWGM